MICLQHRQHGHSTLGTLATERCPSRALALSGQAPDKTPPCHAPALARRGDPRRHAAMPPARCSADVRPKSRHMIHAVPPARARAQAPSPSGAAPPAIAAGASTCSSEPGVWPWRSPYSTSHQEPFKRPFRGSAVALGSRHRRSLCLWKPRPKTQNPRL